MSDDTKPSIAGLTPADAALLEAEARLKRAQAETDLPPIEAAKLRAEATGLEILAGRLRSPDPDGVLELRVGRGSEVSLLPDKRMSFDVRAVAQAVQAPPDILAAQASFDRLTLAREAGALNLAVEAADSVGAEGAIEQMLVHEIAAAHRLSMRLFASAQTELRCHENNRVLDGRGHTLAGANRSAMSGARLMDSVARAAAALDRLRNGGRQQVTVQHVVVADGGQAVVAGTMATGAGRAALARQPNRGGGAE